MLAPRATAEFFGPYTLVNGVIWPKMSVQRRRYRLRLLNGSNARTYCLKLVTDDGDGCFRRGFQWTSGRYVRRGLHDDVPTPPGRGSALGFVVKLKGDTIQHTRLDPLQITHLVG